MSKTTKTEREVEPGLNPLEAYDVALETLMDLALCAEDDTRLAAAEMLLNNVSVPPTVGWDFEEDD